MPNLDIWTLIQEDLDLRGEAFVLAPSTTLDENDHRNILTIVLDKSGFVYRERKKGERIVFEFEDCPCHTDPDGDHWECCVMIEPDGKYSGHCKHDPEKYHWPEFKAAIKWDENRPPIQKIPDGIGDINSFFSEIDSVVATATTTLEQETPSTISCAEPLTLANVIPEQYSEETTYEPTYVIPSPINSDGIFLRGSVCPLGAQQASGKTTILLHGIIRPALEGKPVLGRFITEVPPRVLYIQTDYGKTQFYNKFIRGFGWATPQIDKLRFIHTKNLPEFTIPTFCSFLLQHAKDYDLIVIDTVTTLFPSLVWGKSATEDSMSFIKVMSKISLKYNCCFCPTIHTRKRLETRNDLIPPEIDADSVLGPALKPCESVLGMWPCYYKIKFSTGEFTSGGKEKMIYRYFPIWGQGCLKSLKNVPLLDGYDNTSEFKIINNATPRFIEWLPYENYIKPSEADVLENMKANERLNLYFSALQEPVFKISVQEMAQKTGLSISTVYKSFKYGGFSYENYRLDGMNLVYFKLGDNIPGVLNTVPDDVN
jgi:hypothetical protein